MFKPGTRVVKISRGPLPSWQTKQPLPIGAMATVMNCPPPEANRIFGCDFRYLADGECWPRSGMSSCWRVLDDNEPSKLSIDDMLKTPFPVTVDA